MKKLTFALFVSAMALSYGGAAQAHDHYGPGPGFCLAHPWHPDCHHHHDHDRDHHHDHDRDHHHDHDHDHHHDHDRDHRDHDRRGR